MKMVNECIESYKNFFKNALDFKGKTGRREFWLVFLVNFIIGFVLGFLSAIIPYVSYLTTIYGLVVLVPEITITIRRMHDINKSIWLILLYFIPVIGWIIILVLCAMPSQTKTNAKK